MSEHESDLPDWILGGDPDPEKWEIYLRKDGLPREMLALLQESGPGVALPPSWFERRTALLSRWAALDQDKEGGE